MRSGTKKALVCGAGGFIGSHLVRSLKEQGYWVRGVDIKLPEFSPSAADEFLTLDLRNESHCRTALEVTSRVRTDFDEIYQLAADMGGMGFIHAEECAIMHNSNLINTHMIHSAASMGARRYFFSSTVCVYRDMAHDEPPLTEPDAYPANPDNNYGFEKLYAERMAVAYGKRYGFDVRIARFQNCYGPEGTWCGGREKAPAAMCRKVAEVDDGGIIDIWGDGSAVRSYTYIEDILDGIRFLMNSDLEGPVNMGSSQYVSVTDLVHTVAKVAGKHIRLRSTDGPVGVRSRNFSHRRIEETGWRSRFSLEEGIRRTYPWIQEQLRRSPSGKKTLEIHGAEHRFTSGTRL